MTYQKVKEKLVEEDKIATEKELSRFSLRLALLILGVCLSLSLACACLIGTSFAIVIVILSVFVYGWVFDAITDGEKSFRVANVISKLWILGYILLVGVYIVLRFFNFI